ncbi:type II toxin-antitoxin system RelE/ParE family toxin [Candidatus Woesearchaeota archaeon]|nr:type II toxin-antitoxin system RelE/ParE family toxin [Candidatus Woesearchaeota archaeon]
MDWIVLKTEMFERKFSKLDKSIQKEIEDIKNQLKINPYVGRELKYEFFREKKVGKFRIYYLIYKKYVIVYLITVSEKKDQQKTINTIYYS